MEQKLNYILDRTQPFTTEKVQLLDQLTNSMKINAPDVILVSNHRQNKPTRYGACWKKITTFGTTQARSCRKARSTRQRSTCWSFSKRPSRYFVSLTSAKMVRPPIRPTRSHQKLHRQPCFIIRRSLKPLQEPAQHPIQGELDLSANREIWVEHNMEVFY